MKQHAYTIWRRAGVRTQMFRIDDLAGDFAAIATLGRLTDRGPAATALVASLRARLDTIGRRSARLHRLRAFVAIGRTPIVTAGARSYVDDLLRYANLDNVAHDAQAPWPAYSSEELITQQPDVIIVPNPSPAFDGEPWVRLDAVRAGRVVRIAEDDLLRPGPRVADVVEAIVAQVERWR